MQAIVSYILIFFFFFCLETVTKCTQAYLTTSHNKTKGLKIRYSFIPQGIDRVGCGGLYCLGTYRKKRNN